MNKLYCLLVVALIAIASVSCEIDEICIKGDGPTITRTLELESFTSIRNDLSADVFISMGDTQQVIVEGQENIIELLELEVNNGTWNIDLDKNCIRNNNGLRIFITLPQVDRIEIDGSGSVISENTLSNSELTLITDGSGEMDIALDVARLITRIEGSGTMQLEGLADDFTIAIRGSGDVRAFNVDALRVDVQVRGSGDVEVTAREFLKVDIDGSGDVYYKGDPELDIRIDGSGDVEDAN